MYPKLVCVRDLPCVNLPGDLVMRQGEGEVLCKR